MPQNERRPESLLLVDASGSPSRPGARRPTQARAIVSAAVASTEEIEVQQLDICGEPGDRPVAVAYLNRDVPGASLVDRLLDLGRVVRR